MTAHVQVQADLWTLFWNSELPADGHRSPGELTLWFEDLAAIATTKLIEARSGFFLLYGVSNENEMVHQAIVAGADLLETGKAMASSARFLPIRTAGGKARIFVRYVGELQPGADGDEQQEQGDVERKAPQRDAALPRHP